MWYSPFVLLPANGQTVYIRIAQNPTEPIEATYNTALQQFTTVLTGLTVQAYLISKWRAI